MDKIAVFMGWALVYDWFYGSYYQDEEGQYVYAESTFKPAEDWNHWMLVEERIREEGLWHDYCYFLAHRIPYKDKWTKLMGVMSATLEQRAAALLRVLEERE